jgi:hypothetical protein
MQSHISVVPEFHISSVRTDRYNTGPKGEPHGDLTDRGERPDVQIVAGRVTKTEAAEARGVPRRTTNRGLARFGADEPAGLRDRRHSNYRKAGAAMETVVVQAKKDGLHRGARFLRNYLEFAVLPETVATSASSPTWSGRV